MRPVTTAARRRRRAPGLVAGVIVGLWLVVGCGGTDVALPKPLESAERGTISPDGAGSTADGAGDFCGVLQELADMQGASDDPAGIVESLAAAGDVAPEELRPAFDVLRGVAEQLQGLDPDDPDDMSTTLEVVMDPEVQAAADRIDDYASEQCGIELDEDPSTDGTASGDGTTTDSTDSTDMGDGSAPGHIDSEHVEAILDEHPTSTWADKLNSTAIMNGTSVTLASMSASGLSADEALDACEAVRQGLVSRNPAVTVEIRDVDTLLASSPAGGVCAPA